MIGLDTLNPSDKPSLRNQRVTVSKGPRLCITALWIAVALVALILFVRGI